MLGQPLFSLFTTWWKNSQYFTEMVPSDASLKAPVTYSWICWARQPYPGVESAIRYLRCSELLYQEVFQLCDLTSSIPWSADPEM